MINNTTGLHRCSSSYSKHNSGILMVLSPQPAGARTSPGWLSRPAGAGSSAGTLGGGLRDAGDEQADGNLDRCISLSLSLYIYIYICVVVSVACSAQTVAAACLR